jgi:asparagine synthase (glutamine-hydrolysing)
VKKLNHDALGLFFKYGYIPAPHSVFEHTYKLEPGTYLEWELESAMLSKHTYWDINELYRQPILKLSEEEAIHETESVLKKAFEYRMVADVPVGVFLSGGYDSSAVAALLQSERSQKLKTFSIGFHEPKFNEAPYAKQVAQHLGTDHTEYYCTPQEAKEILPTLPFYFDEPFGDSSAIPTILVSQMARKQVTVSLSADGGDELFGGYYRYPIIQKMDAVLSKVPSSLRKTAHLASGLISPSRIPKLKDIPLIEQRYAKFRSLLQHHTPSDYLKNMSTILDDQTLDRLLVQKTSSLYTYFDEVVDRPPLLLHQLLARDYKTYMVDDILTKVDRSTMSTSLEGREPFLDQHIAAWVAQLDPQWKIRGKDKKYILKQIVHQYIPKEMMDRPKSGFAIPIDSWFKKELAAYFDSYLNDSYLSSQGILNPQVIHEWLKNYHMGKKEYIVPLWNVLMFQLWYEQWMQ